jgi:hypothetical protein
MVDLVEDSYLLAAHGSAVVLFVKIFLPKPVAEELGKYIFRGVL